MWLSSLSLSVILWESILNILVKILWLCQGCDDLCHVVLRSQIFVSV